MKQTLLFKTVLAGLVLLFAITNTCLALTISGRITSAKSSYVHFRSSWDRRDSFQLDHKGYFSTTLTISPYEKAFDLSWVAKDGYGRGIAMLLDPDDVVEITGNHKGEKVEFIKGDVARKNYLNDLLEKTNGLNHRKYDFGEEKRDSVNREIFRYLDTLFVEDPVLAIDCIGFMRYTLFADEYSWGKLPHIWKSIQSVPADVKENSFTYKKLANRLWPGKTMLELSFVDTSKISHRSDEWSGEPILLMFGSSWCRPCRLNNQAYLAQYEALKDKIVLLNISKEEHFRDWQEYALKNQLPWQQGFWVSDESLDSDGLWETYHLNAVPLDILIDQNRKIISFNPGIDEVLAFLNKK
jgi:thiol-disulfide isomerase/thioredoxin